ncbi:TetR/AcrR family transcriptional regulator C-terminal domain-containing protein [Nocardioides limicola]|uniref:TetR/AcrR family transcriptional regulator C-terminal domain-containing protein n=1 Tax=Nocardioides limicola TaxID=2803368 RepID=UPI0027DDFEC2|nr:TetR/AcrR family transcriptional regulator C-terminal domain-containing protein [Nocardioides sp. DJM-14]
MAERRLDRDQVVAAAIGVADERGLAGITMRSVGRALGVEAMSLYHHVGGKDELLDLVVDRVFAEVALPEAGAPWRAAMVARAGSARAALRRHPWALGLLESRKAPGPTLLRHHDAVLGCLRDGGFSVSLAAHAFSALDAYVYGFVLTEVNLPFEADETAAEYAAGLGEALPAAEFPHLAEMVSHAIADGYDYGDEFDFGLHLILDGLEAALARGE